MSFGRILLGLIITAVGAIVTIKADWFYRNFGTIPMFDKYLGSEGGGRLGYKLIGIGIALIGMMLMTNLLGIFIQSTIGRLFRPLGT
jgi:hypothetical protein